MNSRTSVKKSPSPSRPPIEAFEPRLVAPKPWGEEWLVAHTEHYTLKKLCMNAGQSGPLQYHKEKDEAFHLHSGRALVDYDAGDGKLTRSLMIPNQTFHIPPGAVHRVTAISDCVFYEASTPIFEDRVNVEHEYPDHYQYRS